MISSQAVVVLGTTAAATPCENLKAISLPNATITTSQLVMAGSPFPGGGGRGGAPAASAITPVNFCRIVAVLKPSSGAMTIMFITDPWGTYDGLNEGFREVK